MSKFKSQVALAALKEADTTRQLAGHYEVHPTQISHWKRQLLEGAETLFASAPHRADQQAEALQAQLYEEIGRLKIENDFLKKKLPSSLKAKRGLIEPNHPQLSLRRQCHLVDLHRSGYYYEPAKESEENLHLMRLIDEEYMRHPFLGSRRLCDYLQG